MNNNKKNGVVYTPKEIVSSLINLIDWDKKPMSFLDPACGDGNITIKLAETILSKYKWDDALIALSHLTFVDIDKNALFLCISKLNDMLKQKGIIKKWEWKAYCKDSLFDDGLSKYDVIIGNPPYIRTHHLETDYRKTITKKYSFAKTRNTDIYIAFIQMGLQKLSEKGQLIYITPNSWINGTIGGKLRDYLLGQHVSYEIYNYNDVLLFDEAGCYTTIFKFQQHGNKTYKILENNLWVEKEFYNITEKPTLKKWLKTYTGLVTYSDKVFIKKPPFDIDDYFLYDGDDKIELQALKPILKSSRSTKDNPVYHYILWFYEGKKLMDEETVKSKFPFAYNYLKKRKHLYKNTVKWWGLNKECGISCTNPILSFQNISKQIDFVYLNNPDRQLFYCGFGLEGRNKKSDVRLLYPILESEEFKSYLYNNSNKLKGGSYNYKPTTVLNYTPTEEQIKILNEYF